MRISFDQDDTLILYEDCAPEPNRVLWLFRMRYNERLRAGSVELLKKLAAEGWEIFIYTTSYRSVGYIKSLFKFYGVRIDDVISQIRHNDVFGGRPGHELPSKNPTRWKIDLHVDDSEMLAQDAQRFGFNVLRIDPEDDSWTEKFFGAAQQIRERSE